jgi:pyridoxal biosynthesis lyase PdxS
MKIDLITEEKFLRVCTSGKQKKTILNKEVGSDVKVEKLRNIEFNSFNSSMEVNKISKSPRKSGHVARMAAKKILPEIGKEERCDVKKLKKN